MINLINKKFNSASILIALTLLVFSCADYKAASNPSSNVVTKNLDIKEPEIGRVFLIVMENTGYEKMIGSVHMPYLNKLVSKYSLATNYFANTHPSIGNYFVLSTGKIISRKTEFFSSVKEDNLVRSFEESKKSWMSFAESLPRPGYLGDHAYPYVRRHNPFVFFDEVRTNKQLASNIVPYKQKTFLRFLESNQLPEFVYILPDQRSNMHDCHRAPKNNRCLPHQKLRHGDWWLKKNIDPIINSHGFGKKDILILTFDEAEEATDARHGGGRVPMLIIGARVKPGYKSDTFYQHESTLRLICDELELATCPGAGSTASSMKEFFVEH